MGQSRSSFFPLPAYPNRFMPLMQHTLRNVLRSMTRISPKTNSELLQQVEEATSRVQLAKTVNKLEVRLFKLPSQEQTILSKRLTDALTNHVLHARRTSLRLEAAGWLRMFVQAGFVSQPQEMFVTLVTAATSISARASTEDLYEQQRYLTMIFDCFWPFRYPYPAFSWELFPPNEVFYPLAPLLSQENARIQDILIAILAELPTLDDEEISKHLLPLALTWANHADPDRRRRITYILARMHHKSAQAALRNLQADADASVSASAKRAADCSQQG